MGDTKYLSIESISKENTGGKVTLTASLCSSAGIRADLWYSFDREFDDAVCDDRCDAVVTSGGVSVGQKDYLPVVLESLGAEPVFSGVAQKPGSPMLAATLGADSERMLLRAQTKSAADALILDAVLSAAIEAVCDRMEETLREKLAAQALYLTDRFSPGYGDMPLAQSGQICEVLNAGRSIGLTVSQSGILMPRKSVTAVLGISRTQVLRRPKGCEGCSARQTCAFARREDITEE